MTFKITIERAPIGVEFEVGSIAEAISILEQEDTNLRRVVSIGDSLSGNGGEVEQGTDVGGTTRRGTDQGQTRSQGQGQARSRIPRPRRHRRSPFPAHRRLCPT
jgi:hypothetical protein